MIPSFQSVHALAAFVTFLDDTPALTPNTDGHTYNLNVKFSAGNGGEYNCRLKEVGRNVRMKKSCNSLSAEFSGLEMGKSYNVRVRRISGNIRETIKQRVYVPTA